MPATDYTMTTGNGAAITMDAGAVTNVANTSGVAAWNAFDAIEIVSIAGLEEAIETIEENHLSLTDNQSYLPTDLATIPPLTISCRWNMNKLPPLGHQAKGDFLITLPKGTATNTAAFIDGQAFLTRRKFPDIANNELAVGEIEVQYNGKGAGGSGVGPTFTAEATP